MEDFSYLPHSSAPFRNKARLTCAFSPRLLIFGAQMHLSVLPSINWPMHFGYLGKHQKRKEWTFDLRSFIWHWKCAKDAYCCFFYFATPNCSSFVQTFWYITVKRSRWQPQILHSEGKSLQSTPNFNLWIYIIVAVRLHVWNLESANVSDKTL